MAHRPPRAPWGAGVAGAGRGERIAVTGWCLWWSREVLGAALLPVRAGMVSRRTPGRSDRAPAPRACGDGSQLRELGVGEAICSPRTRGWSLRDRRPHRHVDLLPAHTGMAPSACPADTRDPTVPRACGDGPVTTGMSGSSGSCSPRSGDGPAVATSRGDGVLLPAHAGMAPSTRASTARTASAPRVCGDGPWQPHDWTGYRARGDVVPGVFGASVPSPVPGTSHPPRTLAPCHTSARGSQGPCAARGARADPMAGWRPGRRVRGWAGWFGRRRTIRSAFRTTIRRACSGPVLAQPQVRRRFASGECSDFPLFSWPALLCGGGCGGWWWGGRGEGGAALRWPWSSARRGAPGRPWAAHRPGGGGCCAGSRGGAADGHAPLFAGFAGFGESVSGPLCGAVASQVTESAPRARGDGPRCVADE